MSDKRFSMRPTLLISIQRRAVRTVVVALLAPALLFSAALLLTRAGGLLTLPPTHGATPTSMAPPLPPEWPLSLAADAARTVEGEFSRGGTLAAVLQRAGVSPQVVDEMVRAVRDDFNVQQIKAGRPYKVYLDRADDLLLFRYQPDKQTAILVARGHDGWSASKIVVPYEIRPRYVHATIQGSLEGAIHATWIERREAIDLAHKLADIFAWDIDFGSDLRVNDTVDVLVEQRFLEGEFAGFGDVLAAELMVAGRTNKAVRFARPGASVVYYTPTGESLQRAFLRSPVDYSRISSTFSYRRLHPVLNVVRPHYGVDYVAPRGTPVHATSDGAVAYVGRNGEAGNHVRIRHGGSYTTWYLHLSGFAAGLTVGQQIEQGDVIGYVGKTGLTTNYHLDYRMERNGQFVDPLQIDFPAAAPLPVAQMVVFSAQRDRWLMLLRDGQSRSPAVLAGTGE